MHNTEIIIYGLSTDRKIHAIKFLRSLAGTYGKGARLGLRDAKNLCDQLGGVCPAPLSVSVPADFEAFVIEQARNHGFIMRPIEPLTQYLGGFIEYRNEPVVEPEPEYEPDYDYEADVPF